MLWRGGHIIPVPQKMSSCESSGTLGAVVVDGSTEKLLADRRLIPASGWCLYTWVYNEEKLLEVTVQLSIPQQTENLGSFEWTKCKWLSNSAIEGHSKEHIGHSFCFREGLILDLEHWAAIFFYTSRHVVFNVQLAEDSNGCGQLCVCA